MFSIRDMLRMGRTLACSLLVSFLITGIVYCWHPGSTELLISRFLFYLFPSIITYALLLASARHVRAYGPFSCMAGMMIGMTTGMVAGFLAGYYVGATNGLFVGSVFGMVVGIGLGVWLGARYGVMGFMEGAMAGFMSGPMGAMTSVMLKNDHAEAMGVIVLGIGAVLLGALHHMVIIESGEPGRERSEGPLRTILLSLVLTGVTIALMASGAERGACTCAASSVRQSVRQEDAAMPQASGAPVQHSCCPRATEVSADGSGQRP